MNQKERDITFDLVKGIAILTVIIGHVIPLKIIYMFHMPIFFLISGYFYKNYPIFYYVKQNIRSLILSYLKYGLVIVIGYSFLFSFEDAIIFLKILFTGLPIPNDNNIYMGPLWFCLTLFWTRLFYNGTFSFIKNNELSVIMVLFSACLFINWIQSHVNIASYIPYFILQALPALLFFHIGHTFKNNKDLIHQRNIIFLIILILSTISLIIIEESLPLTNFANFQFNNIAVYILNASGISYLVYRICRIVSGKSKERFLGPLIRFIRFCGMNTMTIYMFHCIEYNLLIPLINQSIILKDSQSHYIYLLFSILFQTTLCIVYTLSIKYFKSNRKSLKLFS